MRPLDCWKGGGLFVRIRTCSYAGLAGRTEGSLSREIWSDGSASSPRMGSISSLPLSEPDFGASCLESHVQTLEPLCNLGIVFIVAPSIWERNFH